jgi:SAM-dependent methyltransferase
VLEVGSRGPDLSVRGYVTALEPATYVGVDLFPGPGVDVICPAEQLVSTFGRESFDVVVSTEVLEHVRDWRRVVHNLKGVLRSGGVLVATTRSRGFEFHGYPLDFWRYETDDVAAIFADLRVEMLEPDPDDPGVFFRVRRLASFRERDVSAHGLYSVVRRRRALSLTGLDVAGARCLAMGQATTARTLPHPVRRVLRRRIVRLAADWSGGPATR